LSWNEIVRYYDAFLAGLPTDSPLRSRPWHAEGWGNTPAMADELGGLIAAGTKTATCSAVWEWEAEGQAWPAVGELTVVLDGRDQPLCVVETFQVEVRPFAEVDEAFAFEEGEGDRSLDHWRRVHLAYFTASLARIGRRFDPAMPLVCERFRLQFPPLA